jgi:predicted peroxiredoxin
MSTAEQHIQVIIVSGPEEPKKVVMGLSLAASAAAAGKIVHVFLAMDGARCLLDDACERPLVEGYPPVSELLGVIEATGGVVEYCPHCLPSGCVPRFGAQVAIQKSCACGGAPAGIASYGVHLGDRATVAF